MISLSTLSHNSFLKDSFVYSFGSFLTKAFGFFLIPIFTRYLSVSEYGALSLLMVILQIVTFIFLLGVSTASMRKFFDPSADDDYRRRLYGNSFLILTIFPFTLFILTVPLMYFLFVEILPSIPFFPFICVIFLIGVFKPVQNLMLGLLRVQKRAKLYVIFTTSFFLFQTILVILAVVWKGYGLKGIIYAQLVANIFYWVFSVIILKQYVILKYYPKLAKKLLLFGIPLIPYFVFTWIHNAGGQYMLERYASLEELGIFALAAQFSAMLLFLSESLDNAILPYFYETARHKTAAKELGSFFSQYFVFFGLLSLLTLILAQPLVLLVADPKFHSATMYIPLLIIVGWLNINYKIFYWSLLHSNQTTLISSLTGGQTVVLLGLMILFLKQWRLGITGLIYVLILIGIFKILTGYFFSKKYFKINFKYKELLFSSILLFISAYAINAISLDENIFVNLLFRLCLFAISAFFLVKIFNLVKLKSLISLIRT
ncbi:lipopolysaccharide biosynthesis protein [Acidobacteriota bacterium]